VKGLGTHGDLNPSRTRVGRAIGSAALRSTWPTSADECRADLSCRCARVHGDVDPPVPEHSEAIGNSAIVAAAVAECALALVRDAPVELDVQAVFLVLDIAVGRPSTTLAMPGRQAVGAFDVAQVTQLEDRMAARCHVVHGSAQCFAPAKPSPAGKGPRQPFWCRQPATTRSRHPRDRFVDRGRCLGEVDDGVLDRCSRWYQCTLLRWYPPTYVQSHTGRSRHAPILWHADVDHGSLMVDQVAEFSRGVVTQHGAPTGREYGGPQLRRSGWRSAERPIHTPTHPSPVPGSNLGSDCADAQATLQRLLACDHARLRCPQLDKRTHGVQRCRGGRRAPA